MFVVYIHGFASSPQSSKAQFLARRFAESGAQFVCPDFNQPDFSTLTVSRILGQLEDRIASMPPDEVVLIGSSLGAFVAVEAAARQATKARHPISRLVLLAPAVELEWERWSELGTGGIERWRQAGSLDVFHYAENKLQHLNFEFYEDAQRFRPASRQIHLPVLIFQGCHDESVSPAIVETFACAQSDSTLHLLEDGHQLKNSLEFIWLETSRFLLLDR
jgi:uncharacterized protein